MIHKNTIVLTGAGAAIPWGAPTTTDLTKEIITDKTFKSSTGQSVGNWIYHRLVGLYHKDPETVNFETIINAVEYLITFLSSKNRESLYSFKNLMPAFFEEKDEIWEILWFDRIYEKQYGSWVASNDLNNFHASWNDTDYFFENVFRCFINIIVKEIDKYSENINNKPSLNKFLNEFLCSIKFPLRCYTTNYDRIIPNVYSGEIFEGFINEGSDLKFDLNKVLTDESSNVYYNMHGSAYYEMDFPESVKYSPNKVVYDFGRSSSNNNDQDKRRLVNSNIITGFNKASRILTTPDFQYYLRFYQDCLVADKIFIIGYSFSDIHINHAIKTASFINTDLQIICVSYMVYDEDIEMETEYDWIKLEGKGKNFLDDNFGDNIYEGIVHENNIKRISIYRKGFELFLRKQHWTKQK